MILSSFRRLASLVSLAALAVPAALVACSSSDNTSVSDFAQRYCAELAPCCAAAGRPTDGAQCRAFMGLAGGASIDSAAADRCVSEVHAAVAAPDGCSGAVSGAATPSCDKVFSSSSGSTPPGGTCNKDSDCASSPEGKVRCESLFVGSSEIKKCQLQIVGKAGDTPCLGTKKGNVTSYSFQPGQTDIVARGYICDEADGVYCDSKSLQCTALSAIGGPCSSSFGDQCVDGAYCDLGTDKCVAQVTHGGACDSGVQNCVSSDWCEPTSKVCTTRSPQGSTCSDSRSCTSGNCVNGKCGPSNDIGLALLCGG